MREIKDVGDASLIRQIEAISENENLDELHVFDLRSGVFFEVSRSAISSGKDSFNEAIQRSRKQES